VVGLDTGLVYDALRRATRALLEGASLVALHRNRLFQDGDGAPSPSAGATVAFLEHAAGTPAELLGKPSRPFFELALRQLGARPEECCVVGDDPFTEVEGAKRLGMHAVFVLTGKYPSSDVLERLPASWRPDLVVASLDELPCLRECDP
jgi:ribonucleotide monophosphatase NagD (HAD superfamily)